MNLSDLSRELLEQYYRDSLNINATLRSEIESVKRVANDLAQENQSVKAERDALAAQVELLAEHRHELLDLIYNNAIGQVAMGFPIDGDAMARHAFAITGIDAASTVNSLPTESVILAEIRAEAGRSGYIAGVNDRACEYMDQSQIDAGADQYAAKVRQGGAV